MSTPFLASTEMICTLRQLPLMVARWMPFLPSSVRACLGSMGCLFLLLATFSTTCTLPWQQASRKHSSSFSYSLEYWSHIFSSRISMSGSWSNCPIILSTLCSWSMISTLLSSRFLMQYMGFSSSASSDLLGCRATKEFSTVGLVFLAESCVRASTFSAFYQLSLRMRRRFYIQQLQQASQHLSAGPAITHHPLPSDCSQQSTNRLRLQTDGISHNPNQPQQLQHFPQLHTLLMLTPTCTITLLALLTMMSQAGRTEHFYDPQGTTKLYWSLQCRQSEQVHVMESGAKGSWRSGMVYRVEMEAQGLLIMAVGEAEQSLAEFDYHDVLANRNIDRDAVQYGSKAQKMLISLHDSNKFYIKVVILDTDILPYAYNSDRPLPGKVQRQPTFIFYTITVTAVESDQSSTGVSQLPVDSQTCLNGIYSSTQCKCLAGYGGRLCATQFQKLREYGATSRYVSVAEKNYFYFEPQDPGFATEVSIQLAELTQNNLRAQGLNLHLLLQVQPLSDPLRPACLLSQTDPALASRLQVPPGYRLTITIYNPSTVPGLNYFIVVGTHSPVNLVTVFLASFCVGVVFFNVFVLVVYVLYTARRDAMAREMERIGMAVPSGYFRPGSDAAQEVVCLSEVCPQILHNQLSQLNSFPYCQKCCPICLEQLLSSSTVRMTPCLHIYHSDCLTLWVATSPTCPVCRHRFEPKDIFRISQEIRNFSLKPLEIYNSYISQKNTKN